MHVGLITPSISRHAGGITEVVRNYAHSLQAIPNVNVSVFGLQDAFTKEDGHLWAPVQPATFATVGAPSFGFAPGLLPSLLKSKLSVCHLHILWMYMSIATRVWSVKTKQPYVITTHGLLEAWALNNAKQKKNFAAFLYERNNLQNAGCLHAFTEAEFTSIRNYGLKNPVCIIPSGVQLPNPASSSITSPWRHLIQTGEKVLLYFGRIHPKKGLVNLIQAWAAARKDAAAAGWKLVLAGWDQNKHEGLLKQLVTEAGLEKEMFFLGPQFHGDKEACFRCADAFVLPSFSEGLPMVVLEAWSYKLPVLMTPECHIPQGFTKGAALKTVPNVPELTACLRALFEMSERERMEMGEKGRRLVEAEFSITHAAEQMHAVYQWLLGEGPRPDSVLLK